MCINYKIPETNINSRQQEGREGTNACFDQVLTIACQEPSEFSFKVTRWTIGLTFKNDIYSFT